MSIGDSEDQVGCGAEGCPNCLVKGVIHSLRDAGFTEKEICEFLVDGMQELIGISVMMNVVEVNRSLH